MCKTCWRMVPFELQREVYRTVELRGAHVDKTWAEWWRAQALAIAAVKSRQDSKWDRRAYIDREFQTADHLEKR